MRRLAPPSRRLRAAYGIGFLGLVLMGCGGELPGEPDPDDSDVPAPVPAALVAASPTHQSSLAGASTPAPLVVRVTDALGRPVAGVGIEWGATNQGAICFPTPSKCQPGRWVVSTESDGTSRIWHRPLKLGLETVTAVLPSLPGASVTFVTEATGVLVRFSPVFDCTGPSDPVRFSGPDGSSHIRVTTGMFVEWEFAEWVHHSCLARIVSTSVPPGGESFDSGELSPGARFAFQAGQAGTWDFMDVNSGGAGRLTAELSPGGQSQGEPDAPPYPPERPGLPVEAPRIGVADPDGANLRLLGAGERPSWSPDGRWIVFQRDGAIQVIAADGHGERSLGSGWEPAWSPDGNRIVFGNQEGIAVMGVDGSGVTILLRHGFRDDTWVDDMGIGKPAWSPDGRQIAFEHRGDGDMVPAQIFVMQADGTLPRRITPTTGPQFAESDPAWSLDGTALVFWSYGHGIAEAPASGGIPTSLYQAFPAVAYGSRPGWSPDGTSILLGARGPSLSRALWAIPGGGGSARLVIGGGADPAWSPDGRRIALTWFGTPAAYPVQSP